jgi:iron complex outermembrane receptor protein
VVRGPQGDLYGRNATGGSINVVTRKPTDQLAGNLTLTGGNYANFHADGGISGPLFGNTWKARLAGYTIQRDGYGKNLATGKDIDNRHEYGGRLTLVGQPAEKLSIEVIGDYFHADDAFGSVHQYGRGVPSVPTYAELVGFIPKNPRDVLAGVDPNRNVEVSGVQAMIGWDFNDAWSVKSISAYRREHFTALDELIGTSPSQGAISQLERQHQVSEEIQLLGSGSGWDFILGGYYFQESVDGFIHIPLYFAPGAVFDQTGTGDTKASAIFAHGSLQLIERLKLVLGARYSHEKRTSVAQFTAPFVPVPTGGSKTFNSFTPKVTLQWEPMDTVSLYVGASKGFKSGGFTIGVPGPGVNPITSKGHIASVSDVKTDT